MANITIQKSSAAEIPKIAALLESASVRVSADYLAELVRGGKSLVAKNASGDIVGHSAIFESKHGEIFTVLAAAKPGYPKVLAQLDKELGSLLRKDSAEIPDHVIVPGTCDK